MKLRDYQEAGVKHLMSQQRALLLDDQGTGKTAQSVSALNRLGPKRAVIICPSATRYGWEHECKVWDTRGYRVHVMTRTTEWVPDAAQIVIVSYSLLGSRMIQDQLIKTKWGVMIIDEIHFCKSTKANRTQVVLGGKKRGIAQNATYVWGLSGTPMTNSPIDLWPTMRALGRHTLPESAKTWDQYTRTFCNRFKSRFGHWDVSGSKNLPLLRKCMFDSGFALRRTKEDVLTELPEKTYNVVPMDVNKHGAEIKWGDTLRAAELQKSTLGLGAAELAEARKDIAHDKLDAVIEYIQSTEEPVVVFGWHKEFLERIASECDAALYYGAMSPQEKENSKRRFLNGSARVFAANIQSAGTGLDGLQHRSAHAIFAEIPWTYAEIAQAADRLHRMGQKNPVLIDMIVMRGGVEEYILRTVLKKEKRTCELLLDKEKLSSII